MSILQLRPRQSIAEQGEGEVAENNQIAGCVRGTRLRLLEMDLIQNCMEEDQLVIGLKEDERLHGEFFLRRREQGSEIIVPLADIDSVWPPAALAVRICNSLGSLKDTANSYRKVTECCGVLICSLCHSRGRPQTKIKDLPRGIPCSSCTAAGRKSSEMTLVSCPGRFSLTRRAGQTIVRLLVETACSDHPCPLRLRQTQNEKKRLLESVSMQGCVPFLLRDPAGLANSSLHHTRTYRAKKNTLFGSGGNVFDLMKELGRFESSSASTSLLMVAPYENTVMASSRGKTIHVDSTYRVINPGKDQPSDFRSAPQMISLTMKAGSSYVFLRCLFTEPTNRTVYNRFFADFIAEYELPSVNTYAGFSGDFSTAQLQGFVLAYISRARSRRGLKPLTEEEILENHDHVYSAVKFFRGCGFHYLKALQEIKVIIDSKHHHQQVHEILTLMYKEQDPEKYDDLADSLQKLSSALGNGFKTWLKWWKQDWHGVRFRICHHRFLSRNQLSLSETNNPQEGLHKVIKHDFKLLRTGDFLQAGLQLRQYFLTADKSLSLEAVGYKTTYIREKPPKTVKKRRVSHPIKEIDSNYDLTHGAVLKQTPKKSKEKLNIKKSIAHTRTISSICSWDWRNNSCSLDSALAALLIPFFSSPALAPASPLAKFFRCFQEQLKDDATPKATVRRKMNDLFASLLGALKLDRVPSLWGDPQDRIKMLFSSCWPKGDLLEVFALPTGGISTFKEHCFPDLTHPISIAADIQHALDAQLHSPRFILANSNGMFRKKSRTFPFQFVSRKREVFTLVSVILFQEHVHFQSIFFLGGQTDGNHILEYRSEYSRRELRFLENGVWFHDPISALQTESAPCFVPICQSNKIFKVLNQLELDTWSDLQINDQTCGKRFKPHAEFNPILWMYMFTGTLPEHSMKKYIKAHAIEHQLLEKLPSFSPPSIVLDLTDE